MDLKRDDLFSYLGIQTLYDRYFIHHEERRLETPQIFWMRVAMGLALCEGDQKNERAIEFYNLLSQFPSLPQHRRCLTREQCILSSAPATFRP